jgi:2-keto-3-deoxy-L-fuconate dehydrogenase
MTFSLKGKTAVITAAGQGIGRASTILFAESGATVWATDINQSALNELAKSHPNIKTRILDVRDHDAIQKLAAEIGEVEILFNCAGYVHQGDLLACSQKDWDFSFDLNVGSMYRMCHAVLPAMLNRKNGVVINMASVVSSIKGAPNRCAYGATKGAVIGLTKAIAADYVASNIRCNAICPGTIDTPSLADRIAAQGDAEKVRAAFVARQPMGRLGQPNEIAAMALYLASDEAAFVTGQTFIIDGGWSM